MSLRGDLGVPELINADSMKTLLGGTLMPAPVVEAMHRASESYIDMHELQHAVGQRLADLTHNEAAFVCTGASTGLILATLACITGRSMNLVGTVMRDGVASLARRDFVLQCGQRNPYDPAIVMAGGRIVQVGNVLQTFPWELEAAITPTTAGVFFFAGKHLGFGSLELEDVVRIAHAADVPVIVDAAAQLPPHENLWSFTARGADLVIFSGGKELRGPQASGLILGRRDLIEACALHASPNQRLGRAMKVGKEEMLGLLAAVELYMSQDDQEELARCERIVSAWIEALNQVPGIHAERSFPGTDGRPLPRAVVSFEAASGQTATIVQAALLAGKPAIAVATAGRNSIYLNPELLRPDEPARVLARVAEVAGKSSAGSVR